MGLRALTRDIDNGGHLRTCVLEIHTDAGDHEAPIYKNTVCYDDRDKPAVVAMRMVYAWKEIEALALSAQSSAEVVCRRCAVKMMFGKDDSDV